MGQFVADRAVEALGGRSCICAGGAAAFRHTDDVERGDEASLVADFHNNRARGTDRDSARAIGSKSDASGISFCSIGKSLNDPEHCDGSAKILRRLIGKIISHQMGIKAPLSLIRPAISQVSCKSLKAAEGLN